MNENIREEIKKIKFNFNNELLIKYLEILVKDEIIEKYESPWQHKENLILINMGITELYIPIQNEYKFRDISNLLELIVIKSNKTINEIFQDMVFKTKSEHLKISIKNENYLKDEPISNFGKNLLHLCNYLINNTNKRNKTYVTLNLREDDDENVHLAFTYEKDQKLNIIFDKNSNYAYFVSSTLKNSISDSFFKEYMNDSNFRESIYKKVFCDEEGISYFLKIKKLFPETKIDIKTQVFIKK